MKEYKVVVIGSGAAGLVIAVGLAKAGKRALLIEKGPYGGDCTNFGCIPSKSLIAFAKKTPQKSDVLSRVRHIVDDVRSHGDAAALNKIGIDTITGTAHFKDPHTLIVGDEEVYGHQIVIATGASPLIPPIKGLAQTPYLTNETIFALEKVPSSLAVMGGGPIGCELAQAFQRLGAEVTIIHSHQTLLNKEIPPARELIAKTFVGEGIKLVLGQHVREVLYQNKQFQITLENGKIVETEALLVAVGRCPNVSLLNLAAAGVKYSDKGIPVDAYGRTNQHHIWAIGDVIGTPFFTHWAENQARCVLTSLLLPFKKKLDRKQAIPRVTFTDPEVASIGLTEEEAKGQIATYHVPLSLVDRAITDGRTEGFVTIVTKKWSSQILGCTIVAPRAGEMLQEISLAMRAKIPLRKLAYLIHPYPTYNQGIRKAADLWLTQTILPLFKR